jgi:hypothetical protein
MINHAAQSGRHSFAERQRDLYETPACAVEALLRAEIVPLRVWEPATGRGGIVRVLRAAGHEVIASDIINRDFQLDYVGDFLAATAAPARYDAIVTNPPFRYAAEFVRHALELVPHIYLLLRLAFLESACRTDILEDGSLACVHVFRNRLPFLHRDGWAGPRASSAIAFAWFTWDRTHVGPTIIDRISWKSPERAAAPLARSVQVAASVTRKGK